MNTKNQQRRADGARHRRLPGRRALVLVVGGVVAVSIGAGIAAAQGVSARTAALSSAQAQSAGWPAAKARLYQQGVAKAFPVKPAMKPAVAPAAAPGVPVVVVPDARQAGISDLRQAPFGTADFAVQNSYSNLVKGRWYVAYAGTVNGSSTSAVGGVRVLSADATQNTDITDLGTFTVPGTTSLEVTGYSGDSITLVANTGATFTFNLDTLSFG